VPLHSPDAVQSGNAEAIAQLSDDAAERDIRLMVENDDRLFSTVEGLRPVLDRAPECGFHLDIGHANLRLGAGQKNRTPSLLAAFGRRLAHVHVSDNRGGGEDLHLPLGAGVIDWARAARWLKEAGYDGTVTLEVFSREREHLRTSRRLWLEWWGKA
jgi:sugar phosphate isomerase/epimerase